MRRPHNTHVLVGVEVELGAVGAAAARHLTREAYSLVLVENVQLHRLLPHRRESAKPSQVVISRAFLWLLKQRTVNSASLPTHFPSHRLFNAGFTVRVITRVHSDNQRIPPPWAHPLWEGERVVVVRYKIYSRAVRAEHVDSVDVVHLCEVAPPHGLVLKHLPAARDCALEALQAPPPVHVEPVPGSGQNRKWNLSTTTQYKTPCRPEAVQRILLRA